MDTSTLTPSLYSCSLSRRFIFSDASKDDQTSPSHRSSPKATFLAVFQSLLHLRALFTAISNTNMIIEPGRNGIISVSTRRLLTHAVSLTGQSCFRRFYNSVIMSVLGTGPAKSSPSCYCKGRKDFQAISLSVRRLAESESTLRCLFGAILSSVRRLADEFYLVLVERPFRQYR